MSLLDAFVLDYLDCVVAGAPRNGHTSYGNNESGSLGARFCEERSDAADCFYPTHININERLCRNHRMVRETREPKEVQGRDL
jgi:hypothetical protein